MYTKELKVQTSLRINKDSLQEAKQILDEMGMNFSEAVNIFTKMIVKHKGLPFDVKIPNDETVAAMQRVDNDHQLKSFTLDELEMFLNEHKSR